MTLRHVRQRPDRRSPHRTGRLTRDAAMDNDPRGRTLCGAEPTTNDLDNRTGRSKAGRTWVTCPGCIEAINPPPTEET
jgi:hypothetical protein